jgi:co-chaperonin GroES (HSP10)
MKLEAIHDHVLITDMNFSEHVTQSGIVLQSDDGKTEGIKPRWGKVYLIGPTQTDVSIGEWILVEHGRWTRKIAIKDADGNDLEVRRVDTKAILAVSEYLPSDTILGIPNRPTEQTFDFSQPMF